MTPGVPHVLERNVVLGNRNIRLAVVPELTVPDDVESISTVNVITFPTNLASIRKNKFPP